MDQDVQTITKADDPHYKTPLEFAKWRVNELKKPQQAGIVNETIDTVIQIVNGILGQYIEDDSQSWGHDSIQFEDHAKNKVLRWFLWSVRWIPKLISVIALAPGLHGNTRRVIIPCIIYGTLIGVTLGSESNYNTYRLLALLLLYIISYTELKYLGFMVIFVVSITFESIWLFFKTNENQNE